MIKKLILIILVFILSSNCSFDTRSGIWTNDQKIEKTVSKKNKEQELFKKNKTINKEFNKNFLIKTPLNTNINENFLITNNLGSQIIIDSLNKKSKYGFSKIKYFDYFNQDLIFTQNKNLIFFDKNGSIIKFDDKSKIIWKKNYYTKKEKKQLPILNLSSNGNILVITDNIAKYYAININTGELIWEKSHKSIFVSEIKIDNDKFYVIDSNNDLNCFSLLDGEKVWEFKTDDDFIKSQKKLSIVYDNSKIYFNNTRGDIYSLDKENGHLIWLTPTRKNIDSYKSFLLKTSKLVLDKDNLFFSNNKNLFFSIDTNTGIINWTQNISSDLEPVIVGNIIFSISSDGYLFIVEKNTGNILRITNLYKNIKPRKLRDVSISGFVVGSKKLYLSLDNGKILQIDIGMGTVSSIFKVTNGKISKPFINNGKMFIVKDNAIIKLN